MKARRYEFIGNVPLDCFSRLSPTNPSQSRSLLWFKVDKNYRLSKPGAGKLIVRSAFSRCHAKIHFVPENLPATSRRIIALDYNNPTRTILSAISLVWL